MCLFSQYRRSTIRRRVEKRRALPALSSLADYWEFLRQTPEKERFFSEASNSSCRSTQPQAPQTLENRDNSPLYDKENEFVPASGTRRPGRAVFSR
ncbi:MAG: hypothetical protein AB7G75_34655 [Candidatus Binatia bacterium]